MSERAPAVLAESSELRSLLAPLVLDAEAVLDGLVSALTATMTVANVPTRWAALTRLRAALAATDRNGLADGSAPASEPPALTDLAARCEHFMLQNALELSGSWPEDVCAQATLPAAVQSALSNFTLPPYASPASVRKPTAPPATAQRLPTVGMTVRVRLPSPPDALVRGTVRFVGPTSFAHGVWIGLELEQGRLRARTPSLRAFRAGAQLAGRVH